MRHCAPRRRCAICRPITVPSLLQFCLFVQELHRLRLCISLIAGRFGRTGNVRAPPRHGRAAPWCREVNRGMIGRDRSGLSNAAGQALAQHMFRKCPHCGSSDARRSSYVDYEEQYLHFLRSPYRCKQCGERFWVISHRVRRMMMAALVLLVLLIVGAAIAFLIPAELPQHQVSSPRSAIAEPEKST